ncbi:MAG: ABC transporter ATP-binding protein [Thermoclostridium sp.]|nr:ABC transporter ATP-binding protein [Thermoclostridium sp.]
MLQVKNLTKRYEKVLAVDNISFEVKEGEIGVLLGPNGAGKSTTIKSIAGLLRFNGAILLDGSSNKTTQAKKVFGYVPESAAVYEYLTVWEHMEFIARAYRLGDGWQQQAEHLLARFDLIDKKDKLGKELSKGMQQKISICCALLIKPRMVMFDEPMVGLDPKAIKELKSVFTELKNTGCAVLISTHIIDSIEEVWDRVLIMNKGRVVLSKTRAEVESCNESLEQIFFEYTEGVAGA